MIAFQRPSTLVTRWLQVAPHRHRKRRGRAAAIGPLAKMHVPSDSFGGRSPERKASDALMTFFTFAACKIILAQLEGSGRGGLASYNAQGYRDLMDFLQENPMKNGDEWLAKLMQQNEMLGVRVMEVREAYCTEDFEWDECRKLAIRNIKEANVRLLRQYATERFGNLTSSPGAEAGEG